METQIVVFLQQLGQGTFVDTISKFISRMPFLGALRFVIMMALIRKFKAKRKMILASFVLSGVIFFTISTLGLKHVFVDMIGFRERPYVAHTGSILPIGTSFADTSFPSDHMASTVAMLTVLLFFIPGARPFAVVFAMLMAFSRMHNGMHYPSDVAAAAILGILYGIMGIWIAKKIFKSKK